MITDKRITRAILLLAVCTFFARALPAADPIAYVSTYAQDVITTVDPSTGKVTKVANAGTNGLNFVVSPDQSAAYILACSQGPTICSVEAIDLVSGKFAASGFGGSSGAQTGLALSRDGSLLYFVGALGLTVVNTSTLGVVAQTPISLVCDSCEVAVSPDGSRIYVAGAMGSGGLEIFDARTYAEIAQLLGHKIITGMGFSADGTKLYLAGPNSKTMVTVLDTGSDTVIATVPYTDEGDIAGVAASPDGQTLYVTSGRGLVRIATSTNTVIDQIASAPLSNQVTVSSDSQHVFVSRKYNLPPGLLSFDVAAGTFSTIPVGGSAVSEQALGSGGPVYVLQRPYGIAKEDTVTGTAEPIGTASGTYALTVSSSGNVVAGVSQLSLPGAATAFVSVLSTATHQITGQFTYAFPPDNITPLSLAVSGDGTLGYAGYENAPIGPEVTILELPQGTVKSSFPIAGGSLELIAISPDSSTLYSLMTVDIVFGGAPGEQLCATSLATFSTTGCAVLALDSGQLSVMGNTFTVTPDGSRAYIQTFQADNYIGAFAAPFLSEVDLQSMTVRRAIELPFTSVVELLGTIAYSSATNSVYMTNGVNKGASVVRVDLATFAVAVTQYVGYAPTGMAVTPDGTELLLTGSLGGTQILDGTTLAPAGFIAGGLQQSIVLAPQ